MLTPRPRPLTNVEFVTELMEFAKSGPLMQAFIIESMRRYAEQVASIESVDDSEWQFLSFEAWQACARELKTALEKRMGS